MTMTTAAKKRVGLRKMREDSRRHYSPPPSAAGPRRTLRPRRRRPILDGFADFDDYLDEEEEDVEMEELERRGKKRQLKFVLKLPPPAPTAGRRESEVKEDEEGTRRTRQVARESSSSASSFSYVDDDEDDEGDELEVVKPIPIKKRLFKECDDGSRSRRSTGRESKHNLLQGLQGFVSGMPTSSQTEGTPLPEMKLLEAILDKIQKKDTYEVFAEPVDIDELPDYFDVIEHPMDFGTVRNKLATNAYGSFEQFEDDVFLICSNAMQYNAPNTIYFRQACSMKYIGRKEFHKLRTEAKSAKTDSKCQEKICVNSTEKNPLQKCRSKVVRESFVSDVSSSTTHASGGDACTGLSTVETSAAEPATTSNALADGSSSLGGSKSDKVDELRAKDSLSKFGKKSVELDENRRTTYNISEYQCKAESGMVYDVLEGEQRQLVAVGLDAEYSFARSLARFAGNLGPSAWKIASERIGSAVPSGVKFGYGWVGEYEPLLSPILSVLNNVQPQQLQADINSTIQCNTQLNDKATAMVVKAGGNSNFNEVNFGIKGQQAIKIHSRDSDPVKRVNSDGVSNFKEVNFGIEGQQAIKIHSRDSNPVKRVNHLGGATGGKQLLLSSETLLRNDAPVLKQKNKQVNFNLTKASGAGTQQGQQHYLYSSNNRHVNQASQRPHICDGVVSCKSPGIIQLDGKPMQSEPLKQMVEMMQCSITDGKINAGQLSNWSMIGSFANINPDDTMRNVAKYNSGIVGNGYENIGGHEHSRSDSSRLMGLPFKMFSQSSISNSSFDSSKLFLPAVAANAREKSNTEGAVAAKDRMPAGASPLCKLSVNTVDVPNSSNAPVSTFPYGSSWRTPSSSPGISDDSKKASMSQAFSQPIQVSASDPQVRSNDVVIFPQLVATGMSRFNSQSPQGLLSGMEKKQNRNISPPDLNISFQLPGSPVRHHSGILKDSQQPDLALQL